MKKEIPKHIKFQRDSSLHNGITNIVCPICYWSVKDNQKYCSNCGQRLDWYGMSEIEIYKYDGIKRKKL